MLAMEMIRSWEIKALYGLATKAGLVDKSADEDHLHLIVNKITGKSSIKKLTRVEYFKVHHEVKKLVISETEDYTQPGVSPEQIKKAWALMYRLVDLDKNSKFVGATAGTRMQGAIKKVCKVDAPLKDPFRFVDDQKMYLLIEQLKRYVESAEGRVAKQVGDEKIY